MWRIPCRYAEYRYDAVTGLYYLQSGYYHLEIGGVLTRYSFKRFEDEPLSLNRYVYVESNPVLKVDPQGYWSITKWGRWGYKLWLTYCEAQRAVLYFWSACSYISCNSICSFDSRSRLACGGTNYFSRLGYY
ncbi:hypothetical protein CEN49_13115 [Fischerella thermalis CCMEE 5273]|nr:hypothetical protein CEN49_13115 [Fischerella thermalis CCMEE 5273]PMB17214.1 hypothetical protein CEN45_22480 [Fischerella thermalis CCMEE 5198]